MKTAVHATAEELARCTAIRRDIHAHPELAFAEYRTAEKIIAELTDIGLTVQSGWAGTGVVGVLGGEAGPMIGLRADMDALPLTEANDLPYRSQHPGRMHACGHDGHVAMLLGAARVLARKARKQPFAGSICFVFQPAEEHEGGARAMLEAGLLQQFPMRRIFGLHNWPGLAAGTLALRSGPVMAGTDRFTIRISGRGGHAAMPHQATDVIVAGAALIQALQTLVSRERNPQAPAVLSITRFQAGEGADNILPEEAVLGGTVRFFQREVQRMLEEGMRRICAGMAASFGLEVVLDYNPGYPATVNDEQATAVCHAAAQACLVASQLGIPDSPPGLTALVCDLPPSMGAEDFAYFAQEIPACYAWLGNDVPGVTAHPGQAVQGACTLHSPHYDFNDAIIPMGIQYWVQLAQQALSPPKLSEK